VKACQLLLLLLLPFVVLTASICEDFTNNCAVCASTPTVAFRMPHFD